MDCPARSLGNTRHRGAQDHRDIIRLLIGVAMTDQSTDDRVAEAKRQIEEVTPEEARDLRDRGEGVAYLDVREINEWNLGRLPHAIHIPLRDVESKVEEAIARDKKVVVYCARGNRSALAALSLKQMGYEHVVSMARGIAGWIDIGGEIEE
jgi:sulfur-carrier protein adenylyltransferase/sulfurtransferase